MMALAEYMLYDLEGDPLYLVISLIALTVFILSIVMAFSANSPMRFSAGYIFRPKNSPDEVWKMIHQFLRRRKLRYSRVAKPDRFHLVPYTEVLYLKHRHLYIGMYRNGFVIFTYERYEGDVERLKAYMLELFGL